MEEESATADMRAQLKEDKQKFDQAMESILALEKSLSATMVDNDGEEQDYDDEMDFEGDGEMTPGSPGSQSVYPSTVATGEVI